MRCIGLGIMYAKKAQTDEKVLELLHPLLRTWFKKRFKTFTPPQRYAIPLISEGKNVLIFSATGSGKTLSAFLSILNELYYMEIKNKLEDQVYCVYVSPLRALSNDIRRNLEEPLREMTVLAEELGYPKPKIRLAVRTGDTSQSERSKMLRKPPHILITTPESLAIVLNAPKFSKLLTNVKWVIVDEVHELSDNKRGSHLSLSLERLQDLVGEKEFVRIGLSATQAPIEEIAKWLVGYRDNGETRDCTIVNVYFTKKIDMRVLSPVENLLGSSFEDATEQMYHLIRKLVENHRTTLIFTNTRSGTERVAFKLREIFGSKYIDALGAHHSSLGKYTRLEVEEKLKKGDMKAVVSSSSLELGIDIGYIDLVIQIGSPKSVAKGLQRIGRSGHALDKVSKGRIIVFDRDDLIECAVLARAAYEGKIDRVQIPKNPLDVLAQHIVGMSLTKKWNILEAFKLIKRSYTFHTLEFDQFMSVIKYLAGFYADLEDRQVYRKIWFDPKDGIFGRKKGSRMIYYLNLGTIPDEADFTVVLENVNRPLGHLSEPFVERLAPGDVFVLGGKTYVFKRVSGMRVIVIPAKGRRPTVPSWVGEMLPRSFDLSIEVCKFREMIEKKIKDKVPDEKLIDLLIRKYRVDENAAKSIIEYFKEQIAVANMVPTHKRLVIEEYYDLKGRQNIIFHFPFGRRTNDALSKAYAYVITKEIKENVATSLTDNGFMLILPQGKHIDIERVPKLLKSSKLREVLKRAVFNTELFKHRFRHVATRSFMVLRNYKGHSISVNRQQLKSQQVLNILKKQYPDFPVLTETFREIFEDLMDIQHAEEVLKWIESGKSKVEFLHSKGIPSPFAHSLILVGAEDVVILEDRDALLRELHRKILEKVLSRESISKPLYNTNTIEKLVSIRQHLTDKSKGLRKKDIVRILENVGPLYLFRERKPSIFERMNAKRENVIKWARGLLKRRKIISFRFPNGNAMWIAIKDFPIYYNAVYRDFIIDELGRRVIDYLKRVGKASTKDLLDKFKVGFSRLRLSLKILEQKQIICKSGFIETDDYEDIVIWCLTEDFVPKKLRKDLNTLDQKEALMILIGKYLKANGPTTSEEISNLTGHPKEFIEKILNEMENKGLVISGYFYALKKRPQYILFEDKAILDIIEKNLTGEKMYPEDVLKGFLLIKNRLINSRKLKSIEKNILELLEELGPSRNVEEFRARLKNFDYSQLLKLQKSKKLVLAKGWKNKLFFMLPTQLLLFRKVYNPRPELSDKEELVLKIIEKFWPIDKSGISEKSSLSREIINRTLNSLESKFLIVRWLPEKEKSNKIQFAPAKIFTNKVDISGKSHDYFLAKFVYEIIKWFSPIPKYNLKYLLKIPDYELSWILHRLLKARKIVEVNLASIFYDSVYLIPSELEKLEDLYEQYLSGTLSDDLKEITNLHTFDSLVIRGIKK